MLAEPGGLLSRMADAQEAELIGTADGVLEHALSELDNERADIRFIAEQLTEALAGALLVAKLREERL